ncbi:MAG TPA: diphosphate--fructose-6-phosphate 1-phosphotransferase [Candidatus Tectomicrobia bacterium]
MQTSGGRLGILVGGGPAPGINSAISAAAIEAVNENLEVIGIYDGYEHLMHGRTDGVRPLSITDVSRIHFQGGSILRTSRANPTRQPEDLQRTVQALHDLGVRYLVTIGGDDTAFAAAAVAKAANGAVRVAHIPKTIDNDLPLPGGLPTFGFETARHVGTQLVLNLMEDSRTTNRWLFVVVMGRKAGHLALGIGKAAGATLTLIPEEFPRQRIAVSDVCQVLEGAILKRRVLGSTHGVAVIAEGIGEKLDPEELAQLPGMEVTYDPYGHIRLGEIPLTTLLKREVQRRFAARGDPLSIVDVTLGYELRCAQAIPFDTDYTRTLGYGAVKFLLSAPQTEPVRYAGLICVESGHINVLPFEDLHDPSTGRVRVRMVDVHSEHYHVARKYMIRLEQRDLHDAAMGAKLAHVAHMTPKAFAESFAAAVTLAQD